MVINTLYRQMCGIMEENPNSDAVFEANQLIEFVLGKKRIELLGKDVSETDAQKLLEYAQKRKEGYPLQYILGRWQFFDMDLYVGEGVLIPRQDTETVCEAAFEVIEKMENPTVVDLCSGSGCIALAVKKFCTHSTVTAVEKSDEAFAYLEKNTDYTQLDVTSVKADIFEYDKVIEENSVDVIISNPPYIHPDVRATIQKEVSFEPDMALFAEEEGLLFYRYIAENYRKVLKKGGYLVFEYGFDQQTAVRNILLQTGYNIIKEIVDLGGNARGVVAQKQ
ncbi:MAG: peptide chain release factor N(5)-glutamine methyltransferase [Oscillospiraceae bacterium]|nr:peptide chain release factor N(5)-glutamine methyltransferase [Oscillospiraceae bacterium]